jgi:xylan 1,4-beta-xylosidase
MLDASPCLLAAVGGNGQRHVVCTSAHKGSEGVLASAPLDEDAVYLEIGGSRAQCRAAWSLDGKTWNPLAAIKTPDLDFLFTGLVLGLYATGHGAPATAPADFAWLEMQ